MNNPARAAIQSQRMEMVGRLASSVIHDLNNLLTVIQLNSALIEGGDLASEEVAERASHIGLACKQSAQLTRKVLNLARHRSDEDRPVAVDALVTDLGRLFEVFLAKKAAVHTVVGNEALWVRGSASDLEQMLMNLVLNAIDAMPDGGDVVVACHALPGDDAPAVEITVRDEGTGIPLEVRERILEPFFTTRENEGGIGMGLYIVDQIVQRHGGTLVFESVPPRGTVVRIRLPAGREGVFAGLPIAAQAPARSRTILLIEDDENILRLTQSILARAGYRVLTAEDGETGLEVWTAHREAVAMVLADLILPGALSGRDVVLAARAERPDLPVLYMSGFATAWDPESLFDEEHFIAKPFAPDALLARVAAALVD